MKGRMTAWGSKYGMKKSKEYNTVLTFGSVAHNDSGLAKGKKTSLILIPLFEALFFHRTAFNLFFSLSIVQFYASVHSGKKVPSYLVKGFKGSCTGLPSHVFKCIICVLSAASISDFVVIFTTDFTLCYS